MKKYLQYLLTPRTWISKCVALLCFAPLATQACDIVETPTFATPVEIVASASNQFGIALYKQIAAEKPTENQFMSPYSVFTALAMTSEGAAGSTLQILQATLGLPDTTILHSGVARLAELLSSTDSRYALAVANAIWPEQTTPPKAAFVATIRRIYSGECMPLDFRTAWETSRKTINTWVERQTNNRIYDLLPKGSLDSLTCMVLTNAIFFKGKWKTEFDKTLTQDQPFYLDGGQQVASPMMYLPYQGNALHYAELENMQVLELPYQGDELSMLILLPRAGKFAQIEASFSPGVLESIHHALMPQQVNVWLPRFKMDVGGSIKAPLCKMGMASLFEEANFDGMFQESMPLKISDVFHKGFVEVNEEGTEAAAATAVVIDIVTDSDTPDPIYNFRADHPFIFMIQHNASKSILFMGKVMKTN